MTRVLKQVDRANGFGYHGLDIGNEGIFATAAGAEPEPSSRVLRD